MALLVATFVFKGSLSICLNRSTLLDCPIKVFLSLNNKSDSCVVTAFQIGCGNKPVWTVKNFHVVSVWLDKLETRGRRSKTGPHGYFIKCFTNSGRDSLWTSCSFNRCYSMVGFLDVAFLQVWDCSTWTQWPGLLLRVYPQKGHFTLQTWLEANFMFLAGTTTDTCHPTNWFTLTWRNKPGSSLGCVSANQHLMIG